MPDESRWTLISHHGAVLLYLSANPGATKRSVADAIGVTERHVSRIINDLTEAGYLEIHRHGSGRRNSYSVNIHAKMRHPVFKEVPIDRVIRLLSVMLRET